MNMEVYVLKKPLNSSELNFSQVYLSVTRHRLTEEQPEEEILIMM